MIVPTRPMPDVLGRTEAGDERTAPAARDWASEMDAILARLARERAGLEELVRLLEPLATRDSSSPRKPADA